MTTLAGTYGEDMPAYSPFQDITFLCANQKVPAEIVHQIMASLWSANGHAYLTAAKKTFSGMCLVAGFTGTSIPLHPGAVAVWEEHGHSVPAELK